jgi:hypothetical protein
MQTTTSYGMTATSVDFSKPHTAPIDRENKTALVIDIAVPLAHNVPKTEAEKIPKYENLVLENQKCLET